MVGRNPLKVHIMVRIHASEPSKIRYAHRVARQIKQTVVIVYKKFARNWANFDFVI